MRTRTTLHLPCLILLCLAHAAEPARPVRDHGPARSGSFAAAAFTPPCERVQATRRALSAGVGATERRSSRRAVVTCGMRVTIHIRGRGRGEDDWVEAAFDKYKTRLQGHRVELETTWHKTDEQLTAAALGSSKVSTTSNHAHERRPSERIGRVQWLVLGHAITTFPLTTTSA